MNKSSDYLNISKEPIIGDSTQEVASVTNTPIFQKDDIEQLYTNSPERVARINQILDIIRSNPGISAYQVSKRIKWSYTELTRVVKDLEYCGLILTKVVLVLGRANRKLYAITKVENVPTSSESAGLPKSNEVNEEVLK